MKKKEKFLLRKIAGSNIMMPVGETALKFNGLITANDPAAFIWEHVEEVNSVEELIELLCEEFEVDPERAREDCEKLVAQMKKAGWIE